MLTSRQRLSLAKSELIRYSRLVTNVRFLAQAASDLYHNLLAKGYPAGELGAAFYRAVQSLSTQHSLRANKDTLHKLICGARMTQEW
jgi:hypothetical protein